MGRALGRASLILALGWMAAGAILATPAGAVDGDQAIGARVRIDPKSLARPYATDSVGNSPSEIPRPAGAVPEVPKGFKASLFAEGLPDARWLAVAPNGDVFLTLARSGSVVVLRDEDGDGKADRRSEFLGGLSYPHGMLFENGWFYVADTDGLWRVPYKPGDLKAAGDAERLTARNAFGRGSGHVTRTLVASPDGKDFLVGIGSRGNVDEEPLPKAAVMAFSREGLSPRPFATGTRNPVGLAVNPTTKRVWAVVNERDGLGDGLVPDYLAELGEGDFYGWPYAYIGANPDPDYGSRAPDRVAATKVPDVLFRAHSAPLGLVFYDGQSFPEAYHGDAFVALHGSWNASQPTGYRVVRVPFRQGRPKDGSYETFVTGFWSRGTGTAEVWGRPAGLAVAKNGALLVADDTGGVVWRVQWVGEGP
jgi:glucose/arabinose dehydrogenase